MDITAASNRAAKAFRRQLVEDAYEAEQEAAVLTARLREHERKAAGMTTRRLLPVKTMTPREFVAYLDARHPWLPAARARARRLR